MKKLVLFLIVMASTALVYADDPKIQWVEAGKTQTIAISSTTWTKVPATNDPYRGGILLRNSRPQNSDVAIVISTSSTAALSGLTVGSSAGMALKITDPILDLSVPADMYIFAISSQSTAASQNIEYTEYRIKR